MKLILATIIGGIVLFLLGGLFYALIFKDFFMTQYAAISRPGEPMMWAIALGCLTQAFFMSLMYPKGYQGGSPAKEGFMFGLYVGLLIGVPYFFFGSAMMNVTKRAIATDAAITCVMSIIAGIVIAMVYGRKSAATTTTP
jgi:hypothetical protein